ncbi:MAG: polysaccharide biosynthesis/export family protein [Rhodobacteraceae bacterium]|nr:polysaccharide biosynthesis/export family protein [Paracoccaceae bacterium]
MKNTIIRLACFGCAILLAACASLPRGAGMQSEVVRGADTPEAEFALYTVSRAFLPTVSQWPVAGEDRLNWIGTSSGATSQLIRPGDQLSIQIWDSGGNSLLTSPNQRVVKMDPMTVSSAGTVFLPYVGEVRVAGRSSGSAREQIQRDLESIIPSAQVQLSYAAGRANSVDLIGGVARPGPYAMPDGNFSVLSLISAGGGIAGGLNNPQIRLLRGGQIFGTSIQRLYANPALDTRLRGGDRVLVEADRRYFLSLGAAGREALHPFPKDEVSAMDAAAIIGGVNDARANPKGVLILREYPASAVRPGVRGPRETRVIFALDLTTSDGLFSARNFAINANDLVYISESPVTNTQTIFALVGSVFGLVTIATNN